MIKTVVTTPSLLIVMGDLMQAYETQKSAAGSPENFIFDARRIGMSQRELQAANDRLSDTATARASNQLDIYQQLVLDKIEEIKTEIFREGKQMNSKELLRQFIRESIYHEVEALNAPQPQGYVYRRPKSTDEENPPTTGDYSSQIVKYKADMGNVEYQQMPEDLKEEALRRIIRRKLAESKKKRS